MFGLTLKKYFKIARFGLLIITIISIWRWALSLSGTPYFPRGTMISIVQATTFLSLAYGAFLRRGYGYRLPQALVTVAILALYAQLIVLVSTAVSYLAGIESYFNYSEALNVQDAIPMGQAMVGRVFGLVINTVTSLIECALGFWFGGLLPAKQSEA
jgi:hypothetical protein